MRGNGSKFVGSVSAAAALCEDMREAGAGSHEQLPGALMPGVVDLLGSKSEKGVCCLPQSHHYKQWPPAQRNEIEW